MRLSNIRSRGIKDLRFGQLTADQIMPPLGENVSHLLLASAWSVAHTESWIDDGIVSVSSALAKDAQKEHVECAAIKTCLIEG